MTNGENYYFAVTVQTQEAAERERLLNATETVQVMKKKISSYVASF